MIQGSPDWLKWRNSGVGASDMASLLDLCRYGGTPRGVWKVKTNRSKGFEGNSFTQHGIEMEAKARARYELINMDDMPAACATHPVYKTCIASLDGLSADGKLVLEIKCPKGEDTLSCARAGKVPDHYWPQVQYQLAVTGADELHFFVYHHDTAQSEMVIVKPDLEYQGFLISKSLEFWNQFVLTDTPPPLTEKDVKECHDVPELLLLAELLEKNKALKNARLNAWKADFIGIGGHPKVVCGRVQVSTVNRNGKFSYHKLTVKETA